MARPLRIEYPGAVYHVTARGNDKCSIYLDDTDRYKFLDIVGDVLDECNWKLYAYCLMSNHYHLLVETLEDNLSRGMRQVNGIYTQFFNRHHGKCGHLLQGRYKAILVERDPYLLELCRYIMLNPVRAGMVGDPSQWEWSSFRELAGMRQKTELLDQEWVLSQFGDDADTARKSFRKFVEQGADCEGSLEDMQCPEILGSDKFVRFASQYRKTDPSALTIKQRSLGRPVLRDLFCDLTGDKTARNRTIFMAYKDYGYTAKEIAQQLNLNYFTVSGIIRKRKITKKQT